MANEIDDAGIEAPITINIGNLCKGAIIDAFEKELQKCLDNIYDLDTPATTTRTISLKVKLKPDDARIKIASEFSCDSSLAQPFPVTDVFFVGKVRFLPWAMLAIACFYLACWGGHANEWWSFPTFMVGFVASVGFLVYGVSRGLEA